MGKLTYTTEEVQSILDKVEAPEEGIEHLNNRVEDIATAVDNWEVVNNLQQGGATAALSAEMGKELTQYAQYGRLVGKGITSVSQRINGIVAGHTYRVNIKTPNWDVSSFGSAYDTFDKFAITEYYADGASKYVVRVTCAKTVDYIDVVMPSYTFTASSNVDYIVIFARGVQGQIIEFSLVDITQGEIGAQYFVGNTNIFAKKPIYLRGDRLYHVYLPRTEWTFDNRLGTGVAVWNIYYYADGASSATNIVWTDDFAAIKKDYYFYAPQDGLYYFGGRADADVMVYFDIEDITERWEKIIMPSRGRIFSEIRLHNIVAGENYRLQVLNMDEWEVGDMEETQAGTFQLELYYYTKQGKVVVAAGRKFGDNVPVASSYDFQIGADADVERVYLGLRALSSCNVELRLTLIPQASIYDTSKSSAIMKGEGNIGVQTFFYLQGGVTYTCYLPKEKWDLSGIALDYHYSYFILDYYPDANSNVNIKTFNISREEYTDKVEFTAEHTGRYRVYMRATEGVEVPVFILPSTNVSELSVFEEQMARAKNMGFKRKPTTAEAGYIPTLSFMHISDTHCTNSQFTEPFTRSVKVFNELAKNGVNAGKNLKFILHTGDVRYGHYTDGYDFFAKATESLERNIYVTAGNHDVGNTTDASKCATDAQIYAQMIEPMLDKWSLKSDGGGNPHPDGKNYYFNDFTDEKVRFIVLYEYETDFDLLPSDPSQLAYHRGFRAFRQAQIDWLIEALQTVPAGYGVIIAKHQPEAINGHLDNPFYSGVGVENINMQSWCGYDIVAVIVRAFQNRTLVDYSVEQIGGVVTALTARANFSNVAEGAEFICYCSGHTHQDLVNFLKDFPEQLELNIGCNNVHYTEGTDMLQEDGDKSKNLINVYSIDRNSGYIYIVRIGADFSNTAQDRSYTAIKYRK